MSGTIFPGQSFASPEKGSRPDGNLDISTPNKHQLPDESEQVSSPHNTLRLDSRPTTPTQGTGPIGGAASEGLDSEAMGGGIGLSLDPLFNAGNIQLPPFPTGQPAGSASDDEGRVSAAGPQRLLKGARVCCFRFDAWARPADPTTTADDIKRHDAHVVVVRIRLIMDRLQLLHEGRSSAGIRVTRPPTYFFDPAGAAGWLVLSASSTSLKKWQCVGAGLGCDEVLPISQPRDTTPGVHGYETIGVHFGMTKEETQQIYINTLGDVLLPEPRAKALKRKAEEFIELSRVHPGQAHPTPPFHHPHCIPCSGPASSSSAAATTEQRPRFTMKRSGGAQPTAKRSISLSDQAMQALQIPSGNDAQPPPTMLTGAVRDGGEGRDSPVPSSSVPSSKGKGPPPVLASSLTATCIHYITDTETIEHTLPFIKFFREYVNGNQLSRSQQNSYTMLDFTFFHVLSELVQMQSRIVDLLRNKFAFPVDNLTTDGLNRDDPAWARFREANHADHLRLVQRLDGLIFSTNEAFQELGCAIFDPVSTCFFLAIHALSVKLNSQSEHNAFLGIACQGIAVDMERFIKANHLAAKFLNQYGEGTDDAVVAAAAMTREQYMLDKMPRCLSAILSDPNVRLQVKDKPTRMRKFQLMVKSVCSANKLAGERSFLGCAHHVFDTMQKGLHFYRTLDDRHPNFQLLCNSFQDMDAMRKLHVVVADSKLM